MHSQHALNYKPHLLSLDNIYHGSNNEYLEGIPSLCSKKNIHNYYSSKKDGISQKFLITLVFRRH